MPQEDFDKILAIARSNRPVMYLSGGTPMGESKQESANRVWKELGARLGFVWDSAEDAGTGDPTDFVATPLEPAP